MQSITIRVCKTIQIKYLKVTMIKSISRFYKRMKENKKKIVKIIWKFKIRFYHQITTKFLSKMIDFLSKMNKAINTQLTETLQIKVNTVQAT